MGKGIRLRIALNMKKMNRMVYFSLLMYLLVCISCQNNNTRSIVVEKKGFETLSDSLLSQMPGVLLCAGKYLFWSDPFNSPFAHFIDKETGKEVAATGQYGQGPDDFSMPEFAEYKGDTIFVWDLNEDKQMFVTLNSDGVCSVRHLANRGLAWSYNRIIQLSDNRSIRHNAMSIDHPFSFICGKDTVKFGKDPIKGDFSSDSKYDCFQGEVCYNRSKDLLVYCPIRFEYMAIYVFDGKTFGLKYEYAPTPKYNVSDGDLKILDGTRAGAKGLCFTASYIATLEYDYDNEEVTLPRGRDFSKLPHCIFLRDYSGTLQRKIDLNVPILRIAGDERSDTLYAIVVVDEFNLVKVEL